MPRVKRLGKILHFSKSRNLILRLEKNSLPRIRSRVFDSKLRHVGFVFDVFGPVSKPYVSVKSSLSNPSDLVGRVVYTSDKR